MFRMKDISCIFLILAVQVNTGWSQKLLLTVYYESMCMDSANFIVNQLKPTMEQLHEYVKLQLVPFGKAMSINEGRGGFQCQHGPKECHGNMVQDCALDLMTEYSDIQKLAYVVCEMQTKAAPTNNLTCVSSANLPIDLVDQCVKSGRGTELQLNSEYLTSFVKPRFVPTVTIHGLFNQQIQDHAMLDLTATLCSFLQNVPQCLHYHNTKAYSQII